MRPVSVIMPVLNGERYIRAAIESILQQTWSDLELIVINDGSTDETGVILSSYNDPRLCVLTHEHSQGIARSLNNGIQNSTGRYICRMDADDIAMPTRVEQQLAYLEKNPAVAMVGCNTILIDSGGRTIGTEEYPLSDEAIKAIMWVHNPFAHGTVAMRRSVLDEIGVYSTRFLHNEDYDLWLRILSRFEAANLPDRLLQRRIHGTSVSGMHETEMVKYRLQMLSNAVFHHYRNPLYAVHLARPLAAYLFRRIWRMFT